MPCGFKFLHLVLSTNHKILKGGGEKQPLLAKIDLYLWVGEGLTRKMGAENKDQSFS